MGDLFERITRAWWAEYDQRFWHTIAHGDQCCCVLPAPPNTPYGAAYTLVTPPVV